MGGAFVPSILGGATMAIGITLYTFSKEINSTARPTGGTTYSCVLKEPCGILSPTVSLNLGTSASPTNSNYAYIDSFDRYYYIREWTFNKGLWYATMEVDVLASWRGTIGSTSCYILRSSNESDGKIIDTAYPAKSSSSIQDSQIKPSPWITDSIGNGCYVVGVAGQSTTYYIFTKSALDLFFAYLFSDTYAMDMTANWSSTFPQLKAQCNPLQYITSLMWFPFQVVGDNVTSIRVGWVNVPVACWAVSGSGIANGLTGWTLRKHPQAATRGDYLNNTPFSNYTLFYPPWGTIQLDPECIANSTNIIAEWDVDLRTGQGTLIVASGDSMADNTHVMSWVHSQVGVPQQVSQIVSKGYGFGNAFAPLLSAGANIVAGNYAGAAVTAAAEIGNAAAAKIPSASTIGSNGGINALRGDPAIQYEFKYIVDEDNTNIGRPLCSIRQVSTLGGYIKATNINLSIYSTAEEKEKIIGFMEGGFYYE
jgi:hypothetical protein